MLFPISVHRVSNISTFRSECIRPEAATTNNFHSLYLCPMCYIIHRLSFVRFHLPSSHGSSCTNLSTAHNKLVTGVGVVFVGDLPVCGEPLPVSMIIFTHIIRGLNYLKIAKCTFHEEVWEETPQTAVASIPPGVSSSILIFLRLIRFTCWLQFCSHHLAETRRIEFSECFPLMNIQTLLTKAT